MSFDHAEISDAMSSKAVKDYTSVSDVLDLECRDFEVVSEVCYATDQARSAEASLESRHLSLQGRDSVTFVAIKRRKDFDIVENIH